ncbi:glycosyltransferase family 4 protein [Ralstonia insidiosa]|jgi:glycosyltransferase involved in cell wall biosynthesis|uniref:glycosyltransferase family 4 protein n=1 Tax=Ralstonia TaxID=48736 RepID=UPI000664BA50|nr:glycosyltransferase family 4 protein [Ralstonia insidiosa]KMW47016.1 glycosyl transferase family 1 [Ralstonia sp. MD27]MBX3775493.1 glycosyltransferase family 4 protein [Ralstonia pickettii]NPA01114.1 glycosyltransferase family 4 protein [Betaproteobacteria bacterium]MBA9859661.1 glycosyltransferase [Ralstonia insidiosa]MBA9873225.1 glycosyltransferase [Ralstonia insidiosa]
MKVLVVNNMAPFVWGGAEELADHLARNLIIAGHQAEVLRIPFQWEPSYGIPSQMLMVRNLEISNVDRVIALKFPAYLIRHPRKTLWLLHQYRQAYDLFDAGQSNIADDATGKETRSIIKNADDEAFAECGRIYTNSDVTRKRLAKYNGFDAEVLLPPLNDPELFTGGTASGYVFAGGRVNGMKRQHLLLEAMALTGSHVRLVVAGPPDTPEDADKLARLVEHYGLQGRVHIDLRFLSRMELARYVNEATACAYLPFDEDSLGYVAMEAATAGKPIITASDSGGVLGLVRDGETGWVAEPTAESLAGALERACRDVESVRAMGLAARSLWTDMRISWPNTITRLLA